MWNLMTLDGRFEGPKPWDLDWHGSIFDDELERMSIEQLDTAEALLFGRKTYEGMAAYWASATGDVAERMNAIPKIVASRTLERVEWNNSTLIAGDFEREIRERKQRASKDIFVFGSADLSKALLRAGLFDELRIAIAPLILGSGRFLFDDSNEQIKLTPTGVQRLSSGGVIVCYAPQKPIRSSTESIVESKSGDP